MNKKINIKNYGKTREYIGIGIAPQEIADSILDIAQNNQQFRAITQESCMCTVGVWSGAQKYYGEMGLIQIGTFINSSITSLLGESDREERLLYDKLGKIKGWKLCCHWS